MSARDLLTRAELVKLARVLGTTPDGIAFLTPHGPVALRALATRISAALIDEHGAAFRRLADASRLLPASLVAKIAELVFGPVLSARVAGLMPPTRAVEVARKLRTNFLADVCVALDPRSAADVIAQMPEDVVVSAARVLLERGEYVTMARVVGVLSDTLIRKVIGTIDDEATLVQIAAFIEQRERLVELFDMMSEPRLRRILLAVADGPREVQLAGLTMMSQLTERQQGRIGDIAVGLGAERLKALMAAATRAGAGDVLRRVLRHMSRDSRLELLKILPGFL